MQQVNNHALSGIKKLQSQQWNDRTKKCDYSLKEAASRTKLMNFMAQFSL